MTDPFASGGWRSATGERRGVTPTVDWNDETSNHLLDIVDYDGVVVEWSFLTNHARVLICIAHDPGLRLRDIAARLGITERSAYGIVTDLTDGGYVVKEKDGRRNRYQIQTHLPLPEVVTPQRTIGEVLDVLVETTTRRRRRPPG
jgi:hypothetical protein